MIVYPPPPLIIEPPRRELVTRAPLVNPLAAILPGLVPLAGAGVASGSLPVIASQTVFYEASPVSSVYTINAPSGTSEGDLLLYFLGVDDGDLGTNNPSPSGGWTEQLFEESTRFSFILWTRIAGASEPSSYSITLADSEQSLGAILRITNFNETTPINVVSSAQDSTDTPIAPDITTTTANCLVIRAFHRDTSNTIDNSPSGTVLWAQDSNTPISAIHGGGVSQEKVSAGATGTAQWTCGGTSEDWGAISVAIAPM